VDDYVLIGNPPILQGMQALSVAMWLFVPSDWNASGDWNIIVDKCCAPTHVYVIQAQSLGSSIIIFGVYNGSSFVTSAFDDFNNYKGQWIFIVGTYDSSKIKTYINGVLKNQANQNGNVASNSANLAFGGRADNTPAYHFYGLLDDIRIYNRALSDSEIKVLYDATK
jgi:hypothetical protein